ncbi:hypothetical protein [Asticcacaulis sp.]|uniref:hypothetical protein n=1 Tax=Asticcacaulis sp. TaxID=1872648 RepID=UPI002C35F51F|nr:hypothetical protein [Asticcacaulis sp.]HTM81571.1 hypothetical protein [Asticcacaulis sp.]
MRKNTNLIRVVIPTSEAESDDWNLAIAYADKIATDPANGIKEVLLFVSSKRQLEKGALGRVAGERVAKTLHDKGRVTLSCGISMRAETLATLPFASNGTLVLGFWVDENMMEKVDGMTGISAVVAYPWLEDGIDKWIKIWAPHIHGQVQTPSPPLLSDPVIVAALTSLTTCVNLSNTGLHGHYADQAERTLRILRAKNHLLEPDNIKLWAVKHGWHPNMAADLQKKAKKVAELKAKPSLRSLEGAAATYDYWSSKSAP